MDWTRPDPERVSGNIDLAPGGSPEPVRARVLLVDDEPVSRRVSQARLGRLGCSVAVVDGGQAALAALERETYDLVFMDCEMPELDGYETTRAIRDRESGARHVPIVAMTAHNVASVRDRGLNAGMDDFLQKPAGNDDLDRILARLAAPCPPAAAPDAPARIAPDAFARLLALEASSPGFLKLILGEFENSFEAGVASAERAARAGDASGVSFALHSVRGSSALMGARDLVALCELAEKRARSGELVACENLLTRIVDEQKAVLRALRREVESLQFPRARF